MCSILCDNVKLVLVLDRKLRFFLFLGLFFVVSSIFTRNVQISRKRQLDETFTVAASIVYMWWKLKVIAGCRPEVTNFYWGRETCAKTLILTLTFTSERKINIKCDLNKTFRVFRLKCVLYTVWILSWYWFWIKNYKCGEDKIALTLTFMDSAKINILWDLHETFRVFRLKFVLSTGNISSCYLFWIESYAA